MFQAEFKGIEVAGPINMELNDPDLGHYYLPCTGRTFRVYMGKIVFMNKCAQFIYNMGKKQAGKIKGTNHLFELMTTPKMKK